LHCWCDVSDVVEQNIGKPQLLPSAILQSTFIRTKDVQLECGPMPNLMAALPNIGGALCSTPQSLADAHY